MTVSDLGGQPLVSVIMPTYNRAEFIGMAIESVLSQSYGNFELLIVDDGSTDNTEKTISPYLRDSRVLYLCQGNQGAYVARNFALKRARGTLIAFLDSDNLWEPDKLKIQVAVMIDRPDVDVIYALNETIDAKGDVIPPVSEFERYSGYITKQLLHENFVNTNTTLIRRTCFEKYGLFDDSLRVAGDYELWLRFSVRCSFLYVPAKVAKYRIMSNQLSSDLLSRIQVNFSFIKRFLMQHPNILSSVEKRILWCTLYSRRGRIRQASGMSSAALVDYLRGVFVYPFSLKPWKGLIKLLMGMK